MSTSDATPPHEDEDEDADADAEVEVEVEQLHDHSWARVKDVRPETGEFAAYRCSVCSQIWEL